MHEFGRPIGIWKLARHTLLGNHAKGDAVTGRPPDHIQLQKGGNLEAGRTRLHLPIPEIHRYQCNSAKWLQ